MPAINNKEVNGFGCTLRAKGDLCWATLMQNWIFMWGPLGTTIYFLLFPEQFRAMLAFVMSLAQ
jgi:hypothetical protein